MESSSNILLIITFLMAGTFNVIFPLLLGWWIIKKRGTSWKLFGVGVLTFIGSQIFHIPAVSGLTRAFSTGLLPNVSIGFAPYFNAIVLGLLAGIFEETARWIGYKILKKKADSFGAALTLGAGHGGIEAIFIGVSVLATLISMLALQSSDAALSALPSGQADLARQQVQAYWATAWHMPLAGAVERISALGLHISLSVMVWLAISFRKPIWFWLAVLYHAVVDGLAVLAMSFGVHVWLIEAGLLLISFGMLYLILRTAKRMDQERVVLLVV
ncbi:MAG: YhfC family glutamic-type intramembrane protease [Anaerolineaceae bacterium]|jgi:uncharacterized membrane protein YhfC|nr:YhfC family glutamic-type intramembrane protease [Anaerolineaceae bacterium]